MAGRRVQKVAGNGQLHVLYKRRFCTEIKRCYMIPILNEKDREMDVISASLLKCPDLESMCDVLCLSFLMHHFNKANKLLNDCGAVEICYIQQALTESPLQMFRVTGLITTDDTGVMSFVCFLRNEGSNFIHSIWSII